MFEFTRQHSSVELVELHQLNQVGKFGGAVVKAEEDLAVFFTLQASADAGERTAEEKEEKVTNFTHAAASKNDLYTNTDILFTILGDL